jgi:hypothetical protein
VSNASHGVAPTFPHRWLVGAPQHAQSLCQSQPVCKANTLVGSEGWLHELCNPVTPPSGLNYLYITAAFPAAPPPNPYDIPGSDRTSASSCVRCGSAASSRGL